MTIAYHRCNTCGLALAAARGEVVGDFGLRSWLDMLMRRRLPTGERDPSSKRKPAHTAQSAAGATQPSATPPRRKNSCPGVTCREPSTTAPRDATTQRTERPAANINLIAHGLSNVALSPPARLSFAYLPIQT